MLLVSNMLHAVTEEWVNKECTLGHYLNELPQHLRSKAATPKDRKSGKAVLVFICSLLACTTGVPNVDISL